MLTRTLFPALLVLAVLFTTNSATEGDDEGWVPLFPADGAPAGWVVREWNDLAKEAQGAAWTVKDGVLSPGGRRGTWLVSEKEYGDFILEFEVKLTELGNSGVALRAPMRGDPAFEGMELQFADYRYNPKATDAELTGGIYRAIPPAKQVYRPAEWNPCRIELRGRRLKATLNGVVIHDTDLDRFDQPVKRHDGSLAPPIKDRPAKGHIGFQHLSRENAPIWIRGARIHELAAASAQASAARRDGLFERIHVLQWPKGAHGYRGSMGDFVQLSDGSLMMSFTQEGIMAVKSSDGGKTWGEPFPLVPNPRAPAKGYYCHPSFLKLDDGQILLSYIYATYPTTPYYGHNYYRRSADDGKTWTDQFILTPHPGYVIMHNDRLFRLSTGRIVGIAEYKAYDPSTNDHGGYVGIAFSSDDGGYSWQVSRNTVDMHPVEVQEADAVELKDGRVMMFARTYSGYPVRAYSQDKCETWSQGERIEELPMPYAGLPTVRRIPLTGDLLFLWISERSQDKENPKIHRRCALSAAVSQDEGKTFGPLRHIARDPEDDFGYQCVEFVGNDLALVGYHARDGIHVARIGIDWFYGKQ